MSLVLLRFMEWAVRRADRVLAPSGPIMDETKPTAAPASTRRDRFAGLIRSGVRRRAPLLTILMLLCSTLVILPIVLSIVRGEPVSVNDIVALTLVLAVGFLVLFTFLVVPSVLMDWFGFDEWARKRRGEKQALVDLRPIFRPVARLFSWWLPLRLGRFGEAVILPDSTGIFGAFVVSAWLSAIVGGPFFYFWLFLLGPAVLVSPFVLTAVLWVSRGKVYLVRVFVVIPYWVHRVPHEAELTWPWEEVGFTSPSRPGYDLALGTATSAAGLYHHISAVLERGSKRGEARLRR
jgi:hypothetical protein